MKAPNQILKLLTYCLLLLAYIAPAQECEDIGYDNRPAELGLRLFTSTEVRNVPATVHVIRKDDGTTNLDLNHALEAIQDFSEQSAYVDIFICRINYIDNDDYYALEGSEHTAVRTENNDPTTLNIYFANTVISPFSSNSICGFAYYPTSYELNKGVSVIRNSCANNNNGTTIPHELGHSFNSRHTHSTTELIDGSNCENAGDYVCDTGASPTLSSGNVTYEGSENPCVYVGSATDNNGMRYDEAEENGFLPPDPTNFMGYGRKACRAHFSDGQEAKHAIAADFYLETMGCNSLSTTDIELFKIHPNPFTNQILFPKELRYELYDMLGRKLLTGSSTTINTTDLKSGLYILKLWDGERYEVKKVIKNETRTH